MDDGIDPDALFDVRDDFRDDLPGERNADVLLEKTGLHGHPDDSGFERTHASFDVLGEVGENVVGNVEVAVHRLFAENRFARFKGRRLNVDGETGRETAHEAIGKALDLGRGGVGCENDLFSGLVQRVENVKELVLRLGGTAPVLDVVDEQHIDLFAVERGPFVRVAVSDALRVFPLKVVGGNVADDLARRVSDDVVSDGLQKMRFAEAGRPVDEKRVVFAVVRILGHGEGRAEGEL